MSSTESARLAAQLLWNARRLGQLIPSLPTALAPTTVAQGYAIQRAQDALAGLENAVGWKIAATSIAGQAQLGVDGPLFGRLFADSMHQSTAVLPISRLHMRVAEPEFAFVMASGLQLSERPFVRSDLTAAIGTFCPAIEVPDSRFLDTASADGPALVADGACGGPFVLAPSVASWTAVDLGQQEVSVYRNGELASKGSGANVLGHPLDALTWLANQLADQGIALSANDIVITGASAAPISVFAGDRVEAVFGDLGTVSVTFD